MIEGEEHFKTCPRCLSFRAMVMGIKGWLCTRCLYIIPYKGGHHAGIGGCQKSSKPQDSR
jgi:hypothetical protein